MRRRTIDYWWIWALLVSLAFAPWWIGIPAVVWSAYLIWQFVRWFNRHDEEKSRMRPPDAP
jgi:hypothetical protein